MLADCHVHPNLPLFLPVVGVSFSRSRARRWWREFKEHHLDLVLIAEHSYKHPKVSFELLERERPPDARTLLLPGVEVLTQEMVDIIVFAEDPEYLYGESRVARSSVYTVHELMTKVEGDPRLHAIVPHPYSPGASGIVRQLGETTAQEMVRRAGIVEMHNFSAVTVRMLIDACRIGWLLGPIYHRMCETIDAPKSLLKGGDIAATGGSDAHHPWEIGDCIRIEGEAPRTRAEALSCILRSRCVPIIQARRNYLGQIVSPFTIARERIMRRMHWYTDDVPEPSAWIPTEMPSAIPAPHSTLAGETFAGARFSRSSSSLRHVGSTRIS